MENINFSIKKMRLGNHVKFKNKLHIVNTLYLDQPVMGIRCVEGESELDTRTFSEFELGPLQIHECHAITPIPITPELLENINFHAVDNGGYGETDFYSHPKKYDSAEYDSLVMFEVWNCSGKWTLELLNANQDSLVSFAIRYLHEIENLIFYITNEEFIFASDILKGKSLTKKSTEMNVVIVDSLGNVVGKHAFDTTNNLHSNYYVSITI